MKTENPVTLVMLLSMAKLQSGEGHRNKRWQTAEDTFEQTQEALAHLRKDGRDVDNVVMLYADSLYMNSSDAASVLHEKYNIRTFQHREKLQGLLQENNLGVPVKTMLWNEFVQTQPNYEYSRGKLKELYSKNAPFREAVQSDNTRRDNQDKESLLPSDMFVMEETALFYGLVRGYLQSEKLPVDTDMVIGYPGEMLVSLGVMQKNNLKIYNSKSFASKEKSRKSSWLNLSVKDAPQEEEIYSYTPDARVLQNIKKAEKPKKTFRMNKYGIAASVLLPVGVALITLLSPKTPEDKTEIAIGDYEALVTAYKISNRETPDTVRVRFVRDNPEDKTWVASAYSINDADILQPFMNQMELSYMQDAEKKLDPLELSL